MAPMSRNKSKGHIPGEDVAAYYARRAEGDVGLIITEGTTIDHKASNGYPDVPSFHGKEALAGWKKVVDLVHEKGGKIFPQLWHVGSVRQSSSHHNQGVDNPDGTCCHEGRVPGYAPSKIPHPYVENGEVPHEMTEEDIQDVIDGFCRSASYAKELGFDGLELHGAHGYLIDQFFWKVTNKRSDRYGQDRTLFASELIRAVRKEVGEEFPIDFRLSQWKMGDYEAKMVRSPKELEAFLAPLVNAGVDLFHCSTRRFWEPEFEGSYLNLAGWVKKITGKPVITVGSVGLDVDFVTSLKGDSPCAQSPKNLEALEKALESGDFDLVAVGRALLADASWFQKVAQNRLDEITPFAKELLATLD